MTLEYLIYGTAALGAIAVLVALFGRETVKGWIEAVWRSRK